jgi:hypothetical protein
LSRLSVPRLESAAGPTVEIYSQIKKAIGNVPNTFAAIGAHGPTALKAVLAADAVLTSGDLSKRDQETIKLVISGAAGLRRLRRCTQRARQTCWVEARRSAMASQPAMPGAMPLVRFVHKLAENSGTVSDADFAAIKHAGYSGAQLVDISLAFAMTVFTNVFNRINDADINFLAVA